MTGHGRAPRSFRAIDMEVASETIRMRTYEIPHLASVDDITQVAYWGILGCSDVRYQPA